MTHRSDIEQALDRYLAEDGEQAPDRVVDAVLDQIHHTPQRHALRAPWRYRAMSTFLKPTLAAVAVIALMGVSGIFLTRGPATGTPLVTTSPPSTPVAAAPSAAPTIDFTPSCLMSRSATDLNEVSRGRLDPGTYSYCGVGQELVNVRFTVPAGWEWHGAYLSKGLLGSRGDAAASSMEEARITFLMGDVQVYTDPCQWSESEPDPPTGPTVADLISALAAQPTRSPSTPTERHAYAEGSDTTLPPSGDNGWEGMAIELTVPDDIELADCDDGQFRTWGPDPNVRAHQGPGQRDVVWVVTTCPEECRDYERLVIDASWMPATPADVVTEIEAILESIATGHWG